MKEWIRWNPHRDPSCPACGAKLKELTSYTDIEHWACVECGYETDWNPIDPED